MSNVGEDYQTRLARERLATLNKYIPLRNELRDKFQRWQELKTEFSIGTEQLFKLITTTTKEIGKKNEAAIAEAVEKATAGVIPALKQ